MIDFEKNMSIDEFGSSLCLKHNRMLDDSVSEIDALIAI